MPDRRVDDCTHPKTEELEGKFGETIDRCTACGMTQMRELYERDPKTGRMVRVPRLGAVA